MPLLMTMVLMRWRLTRESSVFFVPSTSRRGVDRGVIEQLVEHGYLAARAVSGSSAMMRAPYGTLLKKTLGVLARRGWSVCARSVSRCSRSSEGAEAFVTVGNRLVERFGKNVVSGNAAAQLASRRPGLNAREREACLPSPD
ncbi:MAG: hypothetical protein ACLTQI_09760 [Slackia sp.]